MLFINKGFSSATSFKVMGCRIVEPTHHVAALVDGHVPEARLELAPVLLGGESMAFLALA